jgi:ATP-dependent DNA helicase RecG
MGISDKRPRKVVGSTAFDQPEHTRKGLIDKLHVMVEFEVLESESKRVLVFNIASRPVGLPVQVDGIAWWYEADSLILMPEDVRRGIYAENGFDFSGEVCRGATLTDLDEKAVSAFRKTWTSSLWQSSAIVALSGAGA